MWQKKKKGTCQLTDIAVSGNVNVIEKEARKILKHTHHTIEIQRMCSVIAH